MWQYKWLIAEHVSQGIRIRPLLMILFRGASVKNTPCTRNTSSRGGKLARDKLQPFEWVLKVLSKCTRFYPGMPPLQVFQQLCVSPLLKKASPWGLTAEALPWTGSTTKLPIDEVAKSWTVKVTPCYLLLVLFDGIYYVIWHFCNF